MVTVKIKPKYLSHEQQNSLLTEFKIYQVVEDCKIREQSVAK